MGKQVLAKNLLVQKICLFSPLPIQAVGLTPSFVYQTLEGHTSRNSQKQLIERPDLTSLRGTRVELGCIFRAGAILKYKLLIICFPIGAITLGVRVPQHIPTNKGRKLTLNT